MKVKATRGTETAWETVLVTVACGANGEPCLGGPLEGNLVASLPTEFAVEAPYPNPIRSRATLRLALPEAADVEAGVYDLMGRRVTTLASGTLAPGYHDLDVDTARWASGVYLVRVQAGSQTATRRLTVVH